MAATSGANHLVYLMSDLPIIDPPTAPARTGFAARAATAGRCLLVGLLAMALRIAVQHRAVDQQPDATALTEEQLSRYVPGIESVGAPDANGRQRVITSENGVVVLACQTAPASDSVIGYRGSSNVLLLLDANGSVTRAELLSSDDTDEHVAAIRNDPGLLSQFIGWTQGDPSTFRDIDATTGATLTSLAIAEGIALRLSGDKPSLRFTDALTPDDLVSGPDLPTDTTLRIIDETEAEILAAEGESVLGRVYRTGPLSDNISGYQGPSEVLLFTDQDGLVTRVRLRRTFDNEPYSGYLNEEDYFWQVFLDKPFTDLRLLDLEAEQVEGVSGATMTSMAVAETVVAAANEFYRRQQRKQTERRRKKIHWAATDTGTVVILLLAMLIGLTRLRGIRWLQVCWALVLISYFGLVTGNLISLAVLMGWAAEGVAWRLAPGLCAVIVVSLIIPPLSKRNLYCTHICPHGAVQQLLVKMRLLRWRTGTRFLRRYRFLPGIVLVAAAFVTWLGLDANLSLWEPFNAWIWYIAGPVSLVLAGLSLLLSAMVPMAWCRYGCGTGRLLEYVRHSARAGRVTRADVVLLTLTAAAWAWVFTN